MLKMEVVSTNSKQQYRNFIQSALIINLRLQYVMNSSRNVKKYKKLTKVKRVS